MGNRLAGQVVMETWFKIWLDKIDQVQVVRSTANSVWVDGRRYVRNGWCDYFPTWEEAHAFLLKKAEDRLNTARLDLQRAQGHLGNVKGMRPPVTEPASPEVK